MLGESIAFIVTHHNKGRLLREAISSIVAQALQSDEIVIVDDASNDSHASLVFDEFFGRNPNIRLFTLPRRVGAAGAKNFGIAQSQSPLIMIVDADDYLLPETVPVIRREFASFPDAGIVFGHFQQQIAGEHIHLWTSVYPVVDSFGWASPVKLASNWLLIGSSPFRRATFEVAAGYDPKHPVTDDVDMFRRALTRGVRAKFIDQTLYLWRRSSSGNNSRATPRIQAQAWIRNYKFYLQALPAPEFILRLGFALLDLVGDKHHDRNEVLRRVPRVVRALLAPLFSTHPKPDSFSREATDWASQAPREH